MVSTVFWREIHRILEIYLDDLIVYGKTKEEFMSNLDITFRRLSEHQLTINPDKCKIGVSSVEYLGHTIDEHGLRFTPEKLTKVVQFKTPANQKEMKSFLGLCTYFHEHVPHFSTLASPLHASVWDYSPKRPIKWTPELSSAFETLKQAVYNCETLYFPQPEGTFIVESDASMLGMGAALFQEIKDVTAPSGIRRNAIAFLSQAFTPTQQRWSTIEQEGYAIYHAITSWRHFLEGTHFVLKTDHRNLSFIDKSEQSKVRRWKIDLQQFNFDIEWIPGDTNMVADILSRQMPTVNLHPMLYLPAHSYFQGPINFGNQTKEGDAYKVISDFHQAAVGHFGVTTTLARMTERGVSWPDMEVDVQAFVQRCPTCQKLSEKSFPISTAHYSSASYAPMIRINVDTIGPLPQDTYGNAYVIVIIDTFTRFVELYKMPDATAISAARALLQHIGRYGTPQEILTDNGPQYYNNIIEHLSHLMGVTHLFTVPYSHQENGIVERSNKEVTRHLRAILQDLRFADTWSEVLPLVQRIINAKVHEATKIAPASLLFGNKIDLDRELLPGRPRSSDSADPPSSMPEYVSNLQALQQTLIQQAASMQKLRDDKVRGRKRVVEVTEFQPEDWVLVGYPDNTRPTKLHAPLQGPYRVVGTVPAEDNSTPTEYILQDPTSQETRKASVHRLRPFNHDPIYTDPQVVALTDKDAYTIEAIMEHKPKVTNQKFIRLNKSAMKFLVKYVGYDTPEWNTWTNLRTNVHLHNYLRQHGLQTLIPQQYRDQVPSSS
jgi:cleavage and polyadenylation specificity factor subunit 1